MTSDGVIVPYGGAGASDVAGKEIVPVAKQVALPVEGAVGPMSFVSWVNGLAPGDLETYSGDVRAWNEAYSQWLKAFPGDSKDKKTTIRRNAPTKLHWRLAQGKAYQLWLGANGKTCKAPLRTYLENRPGARKKPLKKEKVALARCLKQWLSRQAASEGLGACVVANPSGRRKLHDRGVPEHLLLRVRGSGPNYKAPELREALFDWFVDIRASIACVLTPRYVLYKAKELAEQMLASMRQSGVYSPLPQLTPKWLLRWRNSVGISLRKPNSRVKASRPCMEARLKAMWCNLIRLRRLGQWFLQRDLKDSIYGVDEKPLHFNEHGSKNKGTLELDGGSCVSPEGEPHRLAREGEYHDSCH